MKIQASFRLMSIPSSRAGHGLGYCSFQLGREHLSYSTSAYLMCTCIYVSAVYHDTSDTFLLPRYFTMVKLVIIPPALGPQKFQFLFLLPSLIFLSFLFTQLALICLYAALFVLQVQIMLLIAALPFEQAEDADFLGVQVAGFTSPYTLFFYLPLMQS